MVITDHVAHIPAMALRGAILFSLALLKSWPTAEKIIGGHVPWVQQLLHADHLNCCETLAWSGLPVSLSVSMHGSVQSKQRDATCCDCFRSCSQPTVLRQIALLLCPDISGRLRLAKEPSETRRERNCPLSLSHLSVHPLRPAFRPGFLIVSLGEVVEPQQWGGGMYVWCE